MKNEKCRNEKCRNGIRPIELYN